MTTRRRLPITARIWLRWHRRHGRPRINNTISVPSWDPSAIGLLTECPCGRTGAW